MSWSGCWGSTVPMGTEGRTLLQRPRSCPPTASQVHIHPGNCHAWHLPDEPAADVADGAALATDEPPRADDAEGDSGQLGCRASPSAMGGAAAVGAARPRGVPSPLGPLCPRSPSSSHPHGQAPDGPPGARRAHSSELCRPPYSLARTCIRPYCQSKSVYVPPLPE